MNINTNREALYKTAENKLYEYKKLKEYIKNKEQDYIYNAYGQAKETEKVKTSNVTDVTAKSGTLLADDKRLNEAKRWVQAIETAWFELKTIYPEKAKLMLECFGLENKLKYKKWVIREKLMQELSISYKTFYLWRRDCIEDVAFYYNYKK